MKLGKLFILVNWWIWLVATERQPAHQTLARRKRYLAFPKGSSLQLVYCFILSAYGANDLFTIGITVGIAWEIPTHLWHYLYKNTYDQLHARDRRQLYSKLEIFLNKYGENGRSCILRSVCESARKRRDGEEEKPSFLRKILQTLFRFPVVEPDDEVHSIYNEAASNVDDCSQVYPCNLSFLYEDIT